MASALEGQYLKKDNSNIVIRKWEESDLENMSKLLRKVTETQDYPEQCLDIESLRKDMFGTQVWLYGYLAEVVIQGEAVSIGIAVANLSYNLSRVLSITILYILPDWRNKGVGRGLLDAMKQFAISLKCKFIHWTDEYKNTIVTNISKKKADYTQPHWIMYTMNEADMEKLLKPS
ncbi:Diamine N-acetyltransferase [Oopsacas minuta]|uniref:Diamine N-acetyltransferase n=1 Tax=Oopsacas minuta TaxID=111878 RepID=A0AAV7KN71_9METZ|nr:Diamine N-acetyltransferase [Oopsacas minuta]